MTLQRETKMILASLSLLFEPNASEWKIDKRKPQVGDIVYELLTTNDFDFFQIDTIHDIDYENQFVLIRQTEEAL